MKDAEQLYRDYDRVMRSQHFVEEELDYSVLDRHIPFLEKIDELSNSGITIFDLYRRNHAFVSGNVARITGHNADGNETAAHSGNYAIHPDDHLALFEAGTYFLRYAMMMPKEKCKEEKLVNEYRIVTASGQYIRVIEQQMCLENDPRGNIWLALGILDISPDQDPMSRCRSRLIDTSTGSVYIFPPPNPESMLTAREKEILKLISKGLISKEIADKLYISVNTVNTHRQKILEKLKAGNAIEAIKYATERGLL
jgi:DNA-binding NarL/FixJ family response regulator